MDDLPDDDGPGPLDDEIQEPRSNGREARKASSRGRLAMFGGAALDAIKKLGPPPSDLAKLSLWFQRLSGTLAWVALTEEMGPGQQARMKLAYEGADKAGKNAVKALDKERQLKISKRLGLVEEKADGLDEYPVDAPRMGRTRPDH